MRLLKKLTDAHGVSSCEEEVADIMEEEFRKRRLIVERDRSGNVYGYRKITRKPVMVAAHMDEIGLMVKYINKEGYIYFIKIGGIDDRVLMNQRMLIKTRKGYVSGVIGIRAPHEPEDMDERKRAIEYGSLFIDVGAKSANDARRLGISIGDTISFYPSFTDLGDVCTSKALDDRAACYVLLKLAEKLPENVVLVGTTQEEVSPRGKGARAAAFLKEPGVFIAIDTSVAGDHPRIKEQVSPIFLGRGPAIVLNEWNVVGNVSDSRLVDIAKMVCKKKKIGYQVDLFEGGATDAASVHNLKGGTATLVIDLPVRYLHSAVEMINKKDIEDTTVLLKGILGEINGL